MQSLQKVLKNKEVFMLSQDKRRAIVLEDSETYERKILKMLEPSDIPDKDKTYIKL